MVLRGATRSGSVVRVSVQAARRDKVSTAASDRIMGAPESMGARSR
jgi:hypothetical protein